MKNVAFIFLFISIQLSSQNSFVLNTTVGPGISSWMNNQGEIVFTDAAGNVIGIGTVKTHALGFSPKAQQEVLYRFNKIQIGIGAGFQRDFIKEFTTEYNLDGFEDETIPAMKNIYEIDYFITGGIQLISTEKSLTYINISLGSFYLNSDIENKGITRKLMCSASFALNFHINESFSFLLKPQYQYYLLATENMFLPDYNWNIHNLSTLFGISMNL